MTSSLDWYSSQMQFLADKINSDPTSVGAESAELPELSRSVVAFGERAVFYFCLIVSGYLKGTMLVPSRNAKARRILNLEPDVVMLVLTVDYESESITRQLTDEQSATLRNRPYFYKLTPDGIRFVGQVDYEQLKP